MPVGRRRRDQLAVGTVLALRSDRSRLAVVSAVHTGPPAHRTVEVLAADGRPSNMLAPYAYLARWSVYVIDGATLTPDAAQRSADLLTQLRALIATRRQEAEQLASGPLITRYEAAARAGVRVQNIDKHRLAGAFDWAKRGREVLIDRASFLAWLETRRATNEPRGDVAETQ